MTNETDFHELAGRLEGTVRALMLLAAKLELAGRLDGQQYSKDLRQVATALRFDGEHLLPTQRTMNEMANAMDAARERRKSQ
ncbi:hypothetical protein [Glaciimonas immobilis]|uniref:Uncharacterized protein n=1 Tax=Glaciimonas immobilis TaxID=728004 RepID=A0A840RPP0_9BURK|nr:hypothetical protein [Glaciimonas immobilis]KAF3999042.1 hypothetical protein HAV38_03600 [Glaciimonas immobilis]MBB5198469.1 hypothetical protein [Glaciimonas immobilis]